MSKPRFRAIERNGRHFEHSDFNACVKGICEIANVDVKQVITVVRMLAPSTEPAYRSWYLYKSQADLDRDGSQRSLWIAIVVKE